MLKYSALILLMGLLFACSAYDRAAWNASHRTFAEPAETDKRARIRVMAQPNTRVDGMSNSSACFSYIDDKTGVILKHWMAIGVPSFNGRNLGMPESPFDFKDDISEFEKAEFYAAANQPIALFWRYNNQFGGVISTCDFMLTFTPEENKDYEAVFSMLPKEDKCRARIISLSEPYKKVPFQQIGLCPESIPPNAIAPSAVSR